MAPGRRIQFFIILSARTEKHWFETSCCYTREKRAAACFDASRLLNGHTQQINKNVPHAVSCASTKLQHSQRDRDTLRNTPLGTLIKLHTETQQTHLLPQTMGRLVFVRLIHGQSHAAAFFKFA